MDDDELMKKLSKPWVSWVMVLMVLLCMIGLITLVPGPPP